MVTILLIIAGLLVIASFSTRRFLRGATLFSIAFWIVIALLIASIVR